MTLKAPGYISTKDIRKCHFYWNYFLTRNMELPAISIDHPDEVCKVLNDVLPQYGYEKVGFVKSMESYCLKQLIPISNFEWLENNDRACYWMWAKLRTIVWHQLKDISELSIIPDNANVYEYFNLSLTPNNTKERYDCIIKFFDFWTSDYNNKTTFLERKKSEWSTIFKLPKPFKWLDSHGKEQYQWTWEQLSKQGIPTLHFNVTSSEELYHAIFAAFDTWQTIPEIRKLFLIQINKAWSQKKYRNNLEGKKPLNTYLNEETKLKLDSLATKNRRRIHEMLEDIITDAYDREQNSR